METCEAGHIVVAWALGLQVGAAVIGVNGDDAKGTSEIGHARDRRPLDDLRLSFAHILQQFRQRGDVRRDPRWL
jgi:hypothetical protein